MNAVIVAVPGLTAVMMGGSSAESVATVGRSTVHAAPVIALPSWSVSAKVRSSPTIIVNAEGERVKLVITGAVTVMVAEARTVGSLLKPSSDEEVNA